MLDENTNKLPDQSPRAKMKRMILEQRIHKRAKQGQQYRHIPRRPITDPAPLSFAQQRLWIIDQMYPGNAAYNVAGVIRLEGQFNVEALERALGEIIRRHEVLRTTFVIEAGEIVQHTAASDLFPATFSLPIEKLGDKSLDDENELRERLVEEARRPFDLSRGPLLRARIFQRSTTNNILLLTMHHIISDGWSLGVINCELAMLYTAYAQGHPSPLSELPIQYADYAVWQREQLQGSLLEEQLVYWRSKLAGAPFVLELPADHSRPSEQTFAGATCSFVVPVSLAKRLQALVRQEGATLFMALLAIFQILLGRYVRQEDLLIGTPIAGRTQSETEDLIGFFVNTLVLRADLSGEPSFRTVLRRVRDASLAAYDHQDLPFERLVDEFHPERDPSRNPLVQVFFALQSASTHLSNEAEGQFFLEEFKNETSPFDLFLEFNETESGLYGHCTYSTDLFEKETIERLVGHYLQLMEGAIVDPDQSIWMLPLLRETELQQLAKWNATQCDYPRENCIHDLFAEQAARTPEAVAITCDDMQLTYRQLDMRANQLAHYLQQLGVGPNVPVGLCMERSSEMIVALLGILKAGGAYVPLDPGYPSERLTYMLEDIQPQIVLTQARLIARLPGAFVSVALDAISELLSEKPVTVPLPAVHVKKRAYIIYTSGSTGRPKGVEVSHRNVVRLVKKTNFADLSASQVFLQFAPIAFDAATLEIWGPLLNGGRLAIVPLIHAGLEELGKIIQQQGVTTLWLTSGLFHEMVDQRLQDLRSVRQLLAGGDILSVPHVLRVVQSLPECRVINGYGPTENTTFTTCYHVSAGYLPGASVPIGRPIANTQIYVLDSHLQHVPIGVPGELYTGGDGVAIGYLNHSELTAERFIPDPFSANLGARLYRTGDLVRYLPDGNLEFLGRLDDQIKIRGFRVELGEIVAVLTQHPIVQDALVTVNEDALGNKRLVAYVVSVSSEYNNAHTWVELRDYLRLKLPEYMIPATVVFLDAWPLTVNGKIDRRALPAPAWDILEDGTHGVDPENALQESLAAIWQHVLGKQRIGIHDNFFDLGGNSLLATRVISRLRSNLAVDMPMRILFEAPTIAELAEHIELLIKTSSARAKEKYEAFASMQSMDALAYLDGLSDEEVETLLELMQENGLKEPGD